MFKKDPLRRSTQLPVYILLQCETYTNSIISYDKSNNFLICYYSLDSILP